MTEIKSTGIDTNGLKLTPEQEALSIVVASSGVDVALVAFEKTLSQLPRDRTLTPEVKGKILVLAQEDPDKALKVVLGIQNAGISNGMNTNEKSIKIGQIIDLIASDQLKDDPKFISALVHICTYDGNSDPRSIATLINQGWSVEKIIRLQEAGKSVDSVAASKHRKDLNSLIEGDSDLTLLIAVTNVCNLLSGIDRDRFSKDRFMDRVAIIAVGMSKEELIDLMEQVQYDLDPENSKKVNLGTANFEMARTLGLV